jgi:hypothetical protein
MSYIGNQVTSVPFTVDVFNGDGGTVRFGPLVRAPATVASIVVFVGGSYKTPGVDYTIDSNYVVLSAAATPPPGISNVIVHHLGNGVSATQVPVNGSVTPASFSTSANSKISGSGLVGSIIFGG